MSQYQNEMPDIGMPMPATSVLMLMPTTSASMPMPSYYYYIKGWSANL
jgi:hypothetical protein